MQVRPSPRRNAAAALAVVTATALVAGCTSTGDRPAGAPTSASHTAPTVIAPSSTAPLVARDVPTDHASPTVQAAVGDLSVRIDAALAADGSDTPATRLSQRPAAGNQLLVRWTVGNQLPDPAVRHRVRAEAVTVLELVRNAGIDYGSVLLLVTGVALVHGRRTVSVVVRAKFTHGLVMRTEWSRVSPNAVLGMCDDKPAVIAIGYR